ncbi:hypothetical protein WJX72_011027 [[Myrmecia] bisecta]|uniref:Uncharacterized protein n=1 Tax=[Myrmecia] bisecta TaxID=41462 RepID=A0AAW1PXT4_9CHLO
MGTATPQHRARWIIDVRYGVKLEAVALLQEWVRDVASKAGLTASHAQIFSGAVGVPESRLELEVEFDSMAELEMFWGSIPPTEHRAWGQRLQNFIIDGSPLWEIYRTVDALSEASTSTAEPVAASRPKKSSGSGMRINLDALKPKGVEAPPIPDSVTTNDNGIAMVNRDDARMILDWKGDPMYINPGDKMPF